MSDWIAEEWVRGAWVPLLSLRLDERKVSWEIKKFESRGEAEAYIDRRILLFGVDHESLRASAVTSDTARRRNPGAPVVASTRWIWFVRGGAYNPAIKPFVNGKSGCYAYRDRASGTVVYVGESHTGRLWKTSLRHVQGVKSGLFEYANSRDGKTPTEWVHGSPERLESRYWITADGDTARELEMELIDRLAPTGNVDLEPVADPPGIYDEDDVVPF